MNLKLRLFYFQEPLWWLIGTFNAIHWSVIDVTLETPERLKQIPKDADILRTEDLNIQQDAEITTLVFQLYFKVIVKLQ